MCVFSYLSYKMVSSEWHYRAGQFLKMIPNFRASLKEYNMAQKDEPFNERVYYDRAFVRWRLGDRENALKDLKKCLDYVPYFAKARKEYATMLYQVGRQEEALDEFLKAAENHYVARHFIYSYIGIIYMNQGRLREAIEYAKKAEENIPEQLEAQDSQAFFNIGTIYLTAGMLERGKKFLEKALEINPNDTGALVNLGALLIKKGNFEEALPYLESAREKGENSPYLWYNLGVAYFYTGRKEEASSALQKAIAQRPEFLEKIKTDPKLWELIKGGKR